ncbi:MAG: hypothetical protein HGA97_01705 [Chlorobiaceae bacterium]|nr:hypothetical protein [Chlorobiaceae bacterium]
MSSTNLFTVATVRASVDGKTTEFLFNESPQIFRLEQMTASVVRSVPHITEAFSKNMPVRLDIDPVKGVIKKIRPATEDGFRLLVTERGKLENPLKPKKIDVSKIDHNTFNVIDQYLDFSVFSLCKKDVPNYARTREIFDYCAAQSCTLPDPHEVNPCIPFQYVIDGCYARAHQMRRIITTKYKYCCEKVFSFANNDLDTLAVQACKWGGCCVRWWYHVAPLVRVKVKIGTCSLRLAMVIDPGMFDRPVLLGDWLAAQANTACTPNARVTMYSIQPGSAYSPANYEGTAYSTDDDYVLTEETLTEYRDLTTCH